MPAAVADTPNLYLSLAIKYFERAEQAHSPALRVKYREVAAEYRDQALRLMALQLNADQPWGRMQVSTYRKMNSA